MSEAHRHLVASRVQLAQLASDMDWESSQRGSGGCTCAGRLNSLQGLSLLLTRNATIFFNVATIQKYGFPWTNKKPLEIEFSMIRKLYHSEDKTQLLEHYFNAHKILWPEDKSHRWFRLGMKSMVENSVSVFLGPASSNKTYLFAVHALIDFFAFYSNALGIISSTDLKALEMKVWGRVKTLFNRARRRHDWLPGFILDAKMAITVEETDEENFEAREMNCGLACVACVSGGRFVGMGKFQGAKPPHSPGKFDGILKHYGDEAAVMQPSFLDAYSNWMVNNSGPVKAFKGVMGGNPTDISDPLCTAAEPIGGWDSWIDTRLTQEWTSKWYDAHVVAFDGRDNPNRDAPHDSLPFLISDGFVELMRKTHGEDSWQFYQQAIGKPSRGMVSNRVITVSFCELHKAFDDVVWRDAPTIRLAGCDPAFGGGDRCVWMQGEIGVNVEGKDILRMLPFEIVPVRLNSANDAPDQIAEFVFNKSEQEGISPQNIFYDSFGGGLLGNSFAKLFGNITPVPVNSGMPATERPVRFDLFVEERGVKRLKRCNEEYSKFVTEAWFSVREAVHSEQIREMQKSVVEEGQLRLYKIVSRARIEVETKEDMKERVKKSPDLFDTQAILVEGARRLGFKIQRIGIEKVRKQPEPWYLEEARKLKELQQSKMLAGTS
jgi:hypothetical protein